MNANIEARKDNTPEAAEQREKLRLAIELKNYEFNAHGVEMNHRYRSAAVIPDGTPEPPFERDHELYYHPTTWPGARVPHAWLEREGERVSTLDLAGKGRFALLTGIAGSAWADAARAASEQAGVEVAAYVIGPGREYVDVYDDWTRVREVAESGCVLVRPDGHVAWRVHEAPDDCGAALAAAMEQLLHPRAVAEAAGGAEAAASVGA
jgi:2,4-dichlorophenol 6-monooxygenase